MNEHIVVLETLVKRLSPRGVISYKLDPRKPEYLSAEVTSAGPSFTLQMVFEKYSAQIQFSKAYLGKWSLPDLASRLEFDLEQKLTRNIHLTATTEGTDVQIKVEY